MAASRHSEAQADPEEPISKREACAEEEAAHADEVAARPSGTGPRARVSAVGEGEPTVAAIRKKVIDLAGPSIVEMTFLSLVQVLNMALVGHVGPAAVTAVGLTIQPVFMALGVFMALNVGTTALVARAVGARRYDEANEVARQTVMVNIALSAVMSALGYLFARDIMAFMGAGPDVLPVGTSYFRIVILTLSFNTLGMSLTAALRGAGDTVTPMRVNVVANILVVVLGYPLIYGKLGLPALGVLGAGIASGAARLTTLILVVRVVTSGRYAVRLSVRDRWRWRGDLVRRIAAIGLPAAAEQLVLRAGVIVFAKTVAGLGTVTFAAHQIAMNVLALTFMPGQALATAAATLVGQNLGAKRTDWAERCGWEARRLGLCVAIPMGLVFFFLGPWLMRIYTSDPLVIAGGALALRIFSVAQPSQTTQFILAGGLRGAGDTAWPLYTMAFGVWCFRVTLALLFVKVMHLGLGGAWMAMVVDQCVRSVLIYVRFRSGRWKLAKV
jgi:putative MATE family efflux protein